MRLIVKNFKLLKKILIVTISIKVASLALDYKLDMIKLLMLQTNM